jgi:hypothetical protein
MSDHVRPPPRISDIRTCFEYGVSLKVLVSYRHLHWPASIEDDASRLGESLLRPSLQSVVTTVRNP